MNVITCRAQIPVAAALDELGFIATAEDMTEEFVPVV
jgi:hypothetical protein